jgi:hypothetical protein
MRIVLFLLLTLPLAVASQANKSANELAREVTRDYLVTKIFKGKDYQPLSYGELRSSQNKRTEVAWVLEHEFAITDKHVGFEETPSQKQTYSFLFYLDKRMKVVKAVSYTEDKKQD